MKIGIVGAGLAGMSAGYDLLKAGHQVTIYEANSYAGGLAAGFRDAGWDWHLEHFYHHIFETDSDMLALLDDIGIRDKLFFPRPITSTYYEGKIYPFDSALRILKFPPFNILRYARFGFVTVFLRYLTKNWGKLEQTTSAEWMRRAYGEAVYESTWQPILINKFGPYYQDVNMAWMWARLVARSFRLGYFEGGFQTMVDGLADAVRQAGGEIQLNCPVSHIAPQPNGGLTLTANDQQISHDRVLVTTSPQLMSKLTPELPAFYFDQLLKLKSLGAVVMVYALNRRFFADGTYWLNVPASSPDKFKNEFPFLALVEHTNFVDKKHYGGDILLYCGDYVPADHPYFEMSESELGDFFSQHFVKINPAFRPDWIRKQWLFRAKYAQPVPLVNHSQAIPAIQTPIPNLFYAGMSQVYPWDRGTNFAVQIGRNAGKLVGDMA